MRVALRILNYFRKYWVATAAALAAMMLATGIELVIPKLIRHVIDCGIGVAIAGADARLSDCPANANPIGVVTTVIIIFLVINAFRGGFHFAHGYLGEYGAQGIAYDLRSDIYRHLQELSFSWHDRAQTGQLMSRATSDVEQLRNFTGRAVLQLVHFVLTVGGVGFLLATTHWQLALASLATLPFLLYAGGVYGQRVQPLWRYAQEEMALLATIVQENLAGARVVKAFAREPAQIEKFEVRNTQLLSGYVHAARIMAWANPLLDGIANIGLVVVLWYGGYLIINGELSVGQLVAFNTYLMLVVRPVRRLGFLIGQTARAIAAGERVFEILDAPVDVQDAPDAYSLPTIKGHVAFDHVWCSYLGGEPVLRNVSFAARPGEVVALLGATGSGKTTIVNLIPRFYDVSEGRVLIDGHDIRNVEIASLRRQIGIVMQDTTLFTGTVRDNIAFGVPDATDDHIVAVAKAARAHDFIAEFPDSYDTIVGERGVTLSGGQKQRVAIARALLMDPRILILDDFTSSVDTETEVLIREALDVLMRDRTTFVIAQRVSTVQSADLIIVLDRGVVAGIGTHEELLEMNAIYAEVYQLQLVDETVAQTLGEDVAAALTGPRARGSHSGNGAGPAGGWNGAGERGGAGAAPVSGPGDRKEL